MRQVDQYDERFVERGFDAVAESYGEVSFLRRAAESLVDAVGSRPLARVLDVATGPGTAALLMARKMSECEVVGIDIAPGMVAAATDRAQRLRLSNARFEVASALSLPFEDGRFDAVVCSSAIYYMADFENALREWSRVLHARGVLAFSTFGAGVLEPMSGLFDARIRAQGIVVPRPTPLYRLNHAQACRDLLRSVGLTDVTVREQQLGYWIRSEEDWWNIVMNTGFQALVAKLEPEERDDFERAHKAEVRAHATERGLWVDVPVLVACGTVAASS